MPNKTTLSIAALIAGLGYAGCTVTVSGTFWCVDAVGANGTLESDGSNIDIKAYDDWVEGCVALCPWEDAIMTDGEDGNIGPMDPLYDDWQLLRERLFDATTSWCNDVVDALAIAHGSDIEFNQPGDLDCGVAIRNATPWKSPYPSQLKESHCAAGPPGGTGGPGTGGPGTDETTEGADDTAGAAQGPALYGLQAFSQVIDCVPKPQKSRIDCDIHGDFIESLLQDPGLLWADDAYLAPTAAGDAFSVVSCDSWSLLYAVGFRAGDVLTRVDGTKVTDYDQALQIWSALAHGSKSSASANFVRQGGEWKLTVTRVSAN